MERNHFLVKGNEFPTELKSDSENHFNHFLVKAPCESPTELKSDSENLTPPPYAPPSRPRSGSGSGGRGSVGGGVWRACRAAAVRRRARRGAARPSCTDRRERRARPTRGNLIFQFPSVFHPGKSAAEKHPLPGVKNLHFFLGFLAGENMFK